MNYKNIEDIQEYYLYTSPNTIDLTSIEAYREYNIDINPKQFAPVIVYGDNKILNRCFFKKDGSFVFTNKEKLEVKDNDCVYTSYKELFNLEVNDLNGNSLEYTVIENNQVKILSSTEDLDFVNVKYELNDSFILNGKKISFNKSYDDVTIIFEGNSFTPFYKNNDLNLNPYNSDINEGFIYIDKIEHDLKDIKIKISPEKIKSKSGQIATIKIKLIDRNNNPMNNKLVEVSVDRGVIKFIDGKELKNQSEIRTDKFGNVFLIYEVTGSYSSDQVTVNYLDYSKEVEIDMFEVK